jgi:hypothetical protein
MPIFGTTPFRYFFEQSSGESAEPSGNVVFGKAVLGVGKDLFGGTDFNQVAEVEIGGALGDS